MPCIPCTSKVMKQKSPQHMSYADFIRMCFFKYEVRHFSDLLIHTPLQLDHGPHHHDVDSIPVCLEAGLALTTTL